MNGYTPSPWQLPSSWTTEDSSSNDGASEIAIERNSNRQSISYACNSVVNEEEDGWEAFHRQTTTLSQYYELFYPCDTDNIEDAYLKPIARHTMDELATELDLLPIGEACSEENHDSIILQGVSEGKPDVLRHNIPCELLPYRFTGSSLANSVPMCCQTVQMDMEVLLKQQQVNADETSSIIIMLQDALARILNEPHGDHLPVQTLAIADPTLSIQHHSTGHMESNESSGGEFHLMGDRGFTITGGALVGLLLISLFSFFIVSFRRSRRFRTHHHRMIDYSKDSWKGEDEDDWHNMESTVDPDSSDYSSHQGPCGIYRDPNDTSCYSMADSLRDTIFWREPLPMDEVSEADSWAQTDATVGSLEERLEQITAEI